MGPDGAPGLEGGGTRYQVRTWDIRPTEPGNDPQISRTPVGVTQRGYLPRTWLMPMSRGIWFASRALTIATVS
eukprot:5484219-Lingulodinium_polyedra.AAC.1